ncbi:fimbria/pilus outer membrane usher protein [Luteimonas sp. XNQY3]|nr:fimbria/pilus outer membrane usher protein [Luteimonas sp. XNQY3]MCD9005490.1 fimbria/pilus outer membrane usher protein [Luteimonas sp. XNQY3]
MPSRRLAQAVPPLVLRRLAGVLVWASLWPTPPANASPQSAGQLPPPPRAPVADDDSLVHLELVLNGLSSGRIVPVRLRDGHYLVDAAELRALHVHTDDADDEGRIAVDAIAGVEVRYDVARLRLLVDVPPEWLPEQALDRSGRRTRHHAQASHGALLNYDVYATRPDRAATSMSLWTDLRLFGERGVLSSSGAWRNGTANADAGFVRYDTRWEYGDEDRILLWEAGDLITRGTAWTTPVRIGGVQLSRDFSIRPDVVTYPLPQFAGQASVPTGVDLFVNGNLAARERVDPGPFTLTDVPFINGAGQAVVVVTDAVGRQVATTIPFYVSSDLLAPGLTDFAVSAGALRRDYGLDSFSYGPMVASGSYRRGLGDAMTVEALGEVAGDLVRAGAGGVFGLGTLGVLNAAYSRSDARGRSGAQGEIGYQYLHRRFNVSAQHRRNGRHFVDLASYDPHAAYSARRRTTVIAGSVALDGWGSLGAGLVAIEHADATRTRLFNLSWSVSPWRNASLYLSGNRDVDSGDWSAVAQVAVSMHGSFSATHEQHRERGGTQRLRYSRPVPSDGGVGFGAGYARLEDADDQVQADIYWRGRHAQAGGGFHGSADARTFWASAAGSVVRMDGATFLSSRIADAFVVVDTNGFAGIPVRYENQRIGTTDRGGRLLVPWAGAHYAAKYEIDPLALPAHVRTPVVEQRVAVRRGGGYLMHFPVERATAAMITLHDADGTVLPPGTPVATGQGVQAHVGWDGLVYLDGLSEDNTLTVHKPDGPPCTVRFALDTGHEGIARIGPLTCR